MVTIVLWTSAWRAALEAALASQHEMGLASF